MSESNGSGNTLSEAKGLVAVPCSEDARGSAFWACLAALERPLNWDIRVERGSSIARNRNESIRYALAQGYRYLLFLDDDHIFPPFLLRRLLDVLESRRLRILSALYTKRLHPNLPLIFDRYDQDGRVVYKELKDDESGVIEIAATGLGCLLCEVDVFIRIAAQQRFEIGNEKWFTLGELDGDQWNDDVMFFKRCRDSGEKIYIDLETQIGHEARVEVWTLRGADGKWITVYAQNGLMMQLPKIRIDFSLLEENAVKAGQSFRVVGDHRAALSLDDEVDRIDRVN